MDDTGVGIDAADLPRVFDVAYRRINDRVPREDSSLPSGSGLGLPSPPGWCAPTAARCRRTTSTRARFGVRLPLATREVSQALMPSGLSGTAAASSRRAVAGQLQRSDFQIDHGYARSDGPLDRGLQSVLAEEAVTVEGCRRGDSESATPGGCTGAPSRWRLREHRRPEGPIVPAERGSLRGGDDVAASSQPFGHLFDHRRQLAQAAAFRSGITPIMRTATPMPASPSGRRGPRNFRRARPPRWRKKSTQGCVVAHHEDTWKIANGIAGLVDSHAEATQDEAGSSSAADGCGRAPGR